MASWPPLSQKINYLLASQSIVWYLLCEITDIDTSIITGVSTNTDTDTGISPSLKKRVVLLMFITNLIEEVTIKVDQAT